MLRPALVALALALVAGSSLPAPATAAGGAPIVIGAILSYTGASAPLGEPQRNALQLVQREIDARGGVDGHPVRFDIEDDEGKPDIASQLAAAMVGKGVAAILCGTRVAPANAIARVTAASGTLMIYLSPADIWNRGGSVAKTIFEAAPTNRNEATALLSYAKAKLHASTIGILHDDNQYGSVGAQAVTDAASPLGLRVVGTESYAGDATDFTAQIQRLRAAKPDAVILWGATQTPALATRAARTLGLTVPILGSSGILSAGYLKVAGSDGAGVYAPSSLRHSDPLPAEAKFTAAYESQFHVPVVQFAAFTYDAAQQVLRALDATHASTSGTVLATSLETLPPLHGVCGTYHLSSTDHLGLAASDIQIVADRNGTWVTQPR